LAQEAWAQVISKLLIWILKSQPEGNLFIK